MKNNLEYYQHFVDAHLHPKFKMLRVKYGWEGEGKFWALNSIIGKSDECKLDISRKFIVADILELFGFAQKEFEEFINYLVNECELIDRDSNIITTEIVQENFQTTMNKRLKSRTTYEERIGKTKSVTENINSVTENIQSKVKETKLNKSKEGVKSIGTPSFNKTETKNQNDAVDYIIKLWNNTWTRTPNNSEIEKTQELIKKYGIETMKETMREAAQKNFHSIDTLANSLDEHGKIIPLNSMTERGVNTNKIDAKQCALLCGKSAVMSEAHKGFCSIEHKDKYKELYASNGYKTPTEEQIRERL